MHKEVGGKLQREIFETNGILEQINRGAVVFEKGIVWHICL